MVVRPCNEIKGSRPIGKKKSISTKPNYSLKLNSGSRKLECFSREMSYDFFSSKPHCPLYKEKTKGEKKIKFPN